MGARFAKRSLSGRARGCGLHPKATYNHSQEKSGELLSTKNSGAPLIVRFSTDGSDPRQKGGKSFAEMATKGHSARLSPVLHSPERSGSRKERTNEQSLELKMNQAKQGEVRFLNPVLLNMSLRLYPCAPSRI